MGRIVYPCEPMNPQRLWCHCRDNLGVATCDRKTGSFGKAGKTGNAGSKCDLAETLPIANSCGDAAVEPVLRRE
jgi:hypothetical protein